MATRQTGRPRPTAGALLRKRVAVANSVFDALDSRHRRPDIRKLALQGLPARQRRGHFLILRQAKADHVDPAAATDAARDKDDRIQHQFGACLRRVIEMNVEIK